MEINFQVSWVKTGLWILRLKEAAFQSDALVCIPTSSKPFLSYISPAVSVVLGWQFPHCNRCVVVSH